MLIEVYDLGIFSGVGINYGGAENAVLSEVMVYLVDAYPFFPSRSYTAVDVWRL